MPKPLTEAQREILSFATSLPCYICGERSAMCHFTPVVDPDANLFVPTAFCQACVGFFESNVIQGLIVENVLGETSRPVIDVVHLEGGHMEKRRIPGAAIAN